MNLKRHFPAPVAGWAYLICALILLTVGSWVQDMDFKVGMLITEYGLVLLPVLLIGWYFRVDLIKALRLKPLKWRELVLIPVTVVTALPITLFLNMLVITAMAQFGNVYDVPIPSAGTLTDLSVLFFIISVSAGICEEFFFRGMMLDAYGARFGARKGIVISAILFGLFHFSPQNLLGPIFLGLLFGYLVLITESLLAGILAHMTNNGVAVLMMFAANLAQNGSLSEGGDISAMNENPEQMLMVLLFLGVIAIGCTLAVVGLLAAIRGDRRLPVITDAVPVPEGHEELQDTAFENPDKSGNLRLAEVIPLAIPAVLYTAISYYLINMRQ